MTTDCLLTSRGRFKYSGTSLKINDSLNGIL